MYDPFDEVVVGIVGGILVFIVFMGILTFLSVDYIDLFTVLKIVALIAFPVSLVGGIYYLITKFDKQTKKENYGVDRSKEVKKLEYKQPVLKMVSSWLDGEKRTTELYTHLTNIHLTVLDIINLGHYDDFIKVKGAYIDVLTSTYIKYTKLKTLNVKSLGNSGKIDIQILKIVKVTSSEFKDYLDNLLDGDYLDVSTDAEVLQSMEYQDYFGDLKKG